MKVFVYRNLNRSGHMYSIKSLEGISKGKVIGYAPRIVIDNAELRVNEAGRQRVLKEKRKNVHAGCVGDLVMVSGWITKMHQSGATFDYCNQEEFLKTFPTGILINYNPYLYNSFVVEATKSPIKKADRVIFRDGNVGILMV